MLDSLPMEMVEAISRFLSFPEFQRLRLVCSTLEHQLKHQFRDRYFRQHTLAWTVESFQTLLDISHHDHYGSALNILIVDATPAYAIRMWKLNQQRIESPTAQLENEMEVEENAAKEDAESHAKYWNETRFDFKSLLTVFQRVDKISSIAFAYDGMPKHLGKFGRRYCERSQNEMSRPFTTTMAAIAESGIQVDSITLKHDRKHGAVSIGRLQSLSPRLSQFDLAFHSLKVLQVDLRDWRYPEEGFEPPVHKIPFVVRFLAKCVNICRLEVSCFSSLEVDIFAEMARHCRYSHMTHCHLELFRISCIDDLFQFLEPSKLSLQSLSLGHVVLRDEASTWSDIMRRIAMDTNVETVELRDMFTRMGARVGIDGLFKGAVRLCGTDLKERLRSLADQLVIGNWGPAWHLAATAYPFIGLRI